MRKEQLINENWLFTMDEKANPATLPVGAEELNLPHTWNGKDGQDGDSFFKGVDTSNSDYVLITLADGTQIKIPTWKAFEELKELVNQINDNVTSLQAIVEALQNNDYVKSVTPIYELGEIVGYTITFAKSGPVTIYNGKDGADGAAGAPGQDGTDGKDGYTPAIGVKKDTDGKYYWTLNGEWLLDDADNQIPTTGKDGVDGAPGQDGAAGAPGQNGSNGTNGTDGITPKFKIEEGYWYVSYDIGQTWEKLGKAVGENGQDGAPGTPGQNGQPGAAGDSFFQGVNTANTYYVILTLADGTTIKLPTWAAFEDLQTRMNQLNTNVTSLQTIVQSLENNDFVTSVSPFYENGIVAGYTITFSKSGSVTIYHGKDGQDGAPGQNGSNGTNGVDGQTPVIGVKQFEGEWYWTIDGEWLLDTNGNRVKTTGEDGTSGITPELKIEDDYWYVSYDKGQTWTKLGKAKGEDGADGEGKDGDIELLEELAMKIKDGSMCGLGQTAPNPVLTTIRYFRHEYEAHINEKRCPAGVCEKLANYTITDACRGCGLCARNCPVQAISGKIKSKHEIDQTLCIKCGACMGACPFKAITKG